MKTTQLFRSCVLLMPNKRSMVYSQFSYLVSDILGFDDELVYSYISLAWWPIIVFFVLPVGVLILVYASALFLTVYKWQRRLQEAYHHDFWDGARQTLAVLWEAQASIWHGYEVEGLENIPDTGPALLIYYHGALPLDMYYLISKILLYKNRLIHPIGDRFLFYIPGFQTLMKVFKVQAGTVEDCTSLLKQGEIISIAPGGVREALFSHNYELLWNKRRGFAKVALASQAPIIPVFTKNIRQAINTLSYGQRVFRFIYERWKIPLALYYGGFPVKLKTYIGKPIHCNKPGLTSEEIVSQVNSSVAELIDKYQRKPSSILLALLDRFTD